jgi:hypothetical protein
MVRNIGTFPTTFLIRQFNCPDSFFDRGALLALTATFTMLVRNLNVGPADVAD